jgi:hypothetical protein
MILMPLHSLIEFRRIFAFDYRFNDSRSLDEVAERLRGMFEFEDVYNFEEVIRHLRSRGFLKEWKNALAMKSAAVYPTMIYFLFFQINDLGGRLFVLETSGSWYSFEKISLSMRPFCKNAGVDCNFVSLC